MLLLIASMVGYLQHGAMPVRQRMPPPSCLRRITATCEALPQEPEHELQVSGVQSGKEGSYLKQQWPEFEYVPPSVRREAVRSFAKTLPQLPPVNIMVVGGPATGKGTIVPMLAQAFRCRAIGIGSLLRSQARSGTSLGREHAEALARGEPLADDTVLEMLSERVQGSWDVRRNGWVLDGFPRSAAQATAVLGGWPRPMDGSVEAECALRPDCVIVLERPTELMEEFMLGRMTDSASGETYHPRYHPVPDDGMMARLTWRVDDMSTVGRRRIAKFEAEADGILAAFEDNDVPMARVNSARSELETFAEAAEFVRRIALRKLEVIGRHAALERLVGPPDKEVELTLDSTVDPTVSGLVQACRNLNTYDANEYVPTLVGDEQVGCVSLALLEALAPHLALGQSCELATLSEDRAVRTGGLAEGCSARRATVGVRLAPADRSLSARTETVAALVNELVLDGVILASKLRHELQDVRGLEAGWIGPDGEPPPLRLDGGAMVHFGALSYGVHVNGWVASPEAPAAPEIEAEPRPWAVWVARRSVYKATYPGRLDQMVAGSQPSSISILENVAKQCEDDASLPAEVVGEIRASGMVSYRYAAKQGLSTKILATFDIQVPSGVAPVCGDGDVEGFELMPVRAAIDSIRHDLASWKPNSALVMIDFAMRHGILTPDEPGYFEIASLLRSAGGKL